MALTVYLIHDGTQTTLGTLDNTSRGVQSFPANQDAKEFSIRIAGSDQEWLNVHEITVDVNMSGEEVQ